MAVKPANTPPIMSAAKAVHENTATICLPQAFFQVNACLISIALTLCAMTNASRNACIRIVALHGCWTGLTRG